VALAALVARVALAALVAQAVLAAAADSTPMETYSKKDFSALCSLLLLA